MHKRKTGMKSNYDDSLLIYNYNVSIMINVGQDV